MQTYIVLVSVNIAMNKTNVIVLLEIEISLHSINKTNTKK